MRIAILDIYDNVVGYIDNDNDKSLNIYNDMLHIYLKDNISTYEFDVDRTKKDSEKLIVGNHLSFIDNNTSYYFNIFKTSMTENSMHVECYSGTLGLLNDYYVETTPFGIINKIEKFLYNITETRKKHFVIGTNEIPEKRLLISELKEERTRLAQLFIVALKFGVELDIKPVLQNNYKLDHFQIDIYKKNDSGSIQGIGEKRNDIRIYCGLNVEEITREQDITELCTAVRFYGEDEEGNKISIKDKSIYVYDDGKTSQIKIPGKTIIYYTEVGSEYLYAPLAKEQFPSQATDGSWIVMMKKTEYKTVDDLYDYCLSYLKEHSVPKTSYAIKGNFANLGINIGDTLQVIDQDFNPALYLKVRVVEILKSLTDTSKFDVVLDNYTEMF